MDVDASLVSSFYRLRTRTRCAVAALASCLPLSTIAAPLILEPTQTIGIPEASFTSIEDVDIDGDSMIMGVRHRHIDPSASYNPVAYSDAAFLFKRSGDGQWSLVRKLFEEHTGTDGGGSREPLTVAMENGLAAVNPYKTMRVFQRVNEEWVAVPAQGHANGRNLEIDGDTIVGSEGVCGHDARTYRKNVAGTYAVADYYSGEAPSCDEEFSGGDVDISGTRVVIPQPQGDENPVYEPYVGVWEGFPPTTPTKIPAIESSSASIDSEWLSFTGMKDGILGTHFYNRQGLGNWIARQTITMPDAMLAWPYNAAGALQMDDGFVLQVRYPNIDVFQRDAQGKHIYVAKLSGAYGRPNISERTAVAIGADGVKVFNLPTTLIQPELKQDDFQDGNAADWAPQAGSNYSVVASNASYVYRQSSVAGNAISTLGNSDLTNQAIQADVTPTAFNGSDRWFGLITRYTDTSNYYYVTVRQSNAILLRRVVNGVVNSLSSASLPVTLNRTYSLRLEAVGSRLRVYVDNKQVLEGVDSSHAHGSVGLMTYKTSADYDNVTVSTQNFLPLLTDDFATAQPNRWTASGGTWAANASQVYEQSSLAGTSRSITGVATGDQMVQVRVVPTAFATGTERWFGVMARYVDTSNHYYVTLRTNNIISLRRLINGAIQELDSAPLTVQAGAAYRIRLDAIGNSLRVSVNGKHLLEATDSTFPEGKYGLATYKASAQFDDFIAAQP